MRIYLDNCCFNRPFDDQGQTRVRLETEAKLCIQENIRGDSRVRSNLFCSGDESMRTDNEIRVHGLRALVDNLGTVEAEKFISLILREPFDYTKWQQHLWSDKSVAEISDTAMESRKKNKNLTGR